MKNKNLENFIWKNKTSPFKKPQKKSFIQVTQECVRRFKV